MIGLFPLGGATQCTVAETFPPEAVTPVGAAGTLRLINSKEVAGIPGAETVTE